jgi:hypothetical protein
MVNDEIRKKIASLSPREKEVFELVCEGLTYKVIKTKLHMSLSSVKTHMTAVRLKFGIDQLSRSKTTVELNNTYCSALKEIQNESDKIKTTEKELKNEPESKPEIRQKASVEIPEEDKLEKIVKKDDKKPPLQEPQKTINEKKDGNQMKNTGERKNDRFRSLKTIWRLISIAAIIFSGYMIYDHFFGPNPNQPAPSPEDPAVQQEQIAAAVETQLKLAEEIQSTTIPTEMVIVPTENIQPTAIPTEIVIVPTEHPAPAPQPAIMFEDDFDDGLSDAWEIVQGNPIVVNGMLSTDQNTWLMVGDPSWKNYSIEFTSTEKDYNSFYSGFNAIGVRASDIDNMYAFKWTEAESICSIVRNGDWSEVPQSDFKPGYSPYIFRIIVKDDKISVFLDDELKASFFNNEYIQGRIALKIYDVTSIDNFKIREILE